MRTVRACLLCVLVACVACASRVPSAKSPTEPAVASSVPSTALKFPAREELGEVRQAAPTSSVERIYELPQTDTAPWLGSADAKVKLEICADFQSPYCAKVAPILHDLNENYGELLRIVWRNCPLPIHEAALPAAEAALEVQAQGGNPAFWAYHDLLFTHQSELGSEALVRYARAIQGVDAERVRAALLDHRHSAQVQREVTALVQSGAAAGGFGTPVSFINGRMLVGALPYETFEDAVERALQEQPDARVRAEGDSQTAYPMARVRHILVQYTGASAAEPSLKRSQVEAKQRAEMLRWRVVQEHIPFASVAKEASECPSAKEGGEVGRFTLGELNLQLELALFALAPGQVSEVVESPFGYHILLREE